MYTLAIVITILIILLSGAVYISYAYYKFYSDRRALRISKLNDYTLTEFKSELPNRVFIKKPPTSSTARCSSYCSLTSGCQAFDMVGSDCVLQGASTDGKTQVTTLKPIKRYTRK